MNRLASISSLIVLAAACGSHSSATPGSDAGAPPADAAPDGNPPPDAPPAPAADPFAALAALPATCTADGWCWRVPTPAGNDYAHVFSTSPTNIWLVGAHDTVLQWDGASWHVHHPQVQDGVPPGAYATAITGLAGNDMWLISGATVQHWDGTAWTIKDSLPPNGIHGFDQIWEAPDGDVWVSRNDGMVDRALAGQAFATIDTGCNCFLGSVWGLAADDFWVTTLPGGIMHANGHSFTPSYTGGTPIGSFTGVAANDIWVTGESDAMVHWDGKTWTAMSSGVPTNSFFTSAVGALAADDIWWWVEGPSSVTSDFLHWDGKALTVTPVDTSAVGALLFAGAIIDGTWWLVGGQGAVYTKVADNVVKPVISPNELAIEGMWGTAADNIYLATAGEIRKWDGKTLSIIEPLTGADSISGIHSDAGDELFSIGFELTADRAHYIADAYHYDGTAWAKTQLDQSLIADHRYFAKVWAMAAGEAMAVGYGGIAYHYADGAWSAVSSGVTTDLTDVWGPDADHLTIVGTAGTLLSWTRANPGVMTPDPSLTTTDNLSAITSCGGATWIGDSSSSMIWRNAGAGWTQLAANVVASGIACTSDGQLVVASAGQSQLARWNGKGFVTEDTGAASPTPVVFQPPGGAMWAGGISVLVEHP